MLHVYNLVSLGLFPMPRPHVANILRYFTEFLSRSTNRGHKSLPQEWRRFDRSLRIDCRWKRSFFN